MTILAHFACAEAAADTASREAEASTFRRARRSSGSSADMDYTEKIEEEPDHVIRRLKYERDLLKHQLGIANKQKDELSLQVHGMGMHYSNSCPAFAPYLAAASPRRNPLSPNRAISSPFSCLHNLPIDEEDAQLLNGDGTLIPASYQGLSTNPMAMRSTASSPTPGVQRCGGVYMFPGSFGSQTSFLDMPRARPPLHVNTVPRSRGTTPPVSPQQTSPNLSSQGLLLDALDSIASEHSEAIRSDLQLLGLDIDEYYENPDRKRADDLQAEVERLQRVLEVERQERKGLDCRIRELENMVEGLRHDKHDLQHQLASIPSKLSPSASNRNSRNEDFDRADVLDQMVKPGRLTPRYS